MPEPLLHSAAPVFTVDGRRVGELARDVLRLEVRHDTRGLKTLQLHLVALGPRPGEADDALLHLGGDPLRFGSEMRVSLGPSGSDRTVFTGRISGLEGRFTEAAPPEVVVFAEDELMGLRMTRHMRSYRDVTDAGIAEEVAARHGLAVRAAAPGPTYDVVHQVDMSDLAFLRERAALVQADVWVDGGTLHFEARAERSGAEITLVAGTHLVDVALRADLAHQRTAFAVSGYDAARREAVAETVGADAVRAEVAAGAIGPDVLERAFGARATQRVREVPLASPEAADWARAQMLRRGRRFVTASGVTRGTPELEVGSRLRLERVGAPFEGGDYYVTAVTHTYDLESGHRTHFEAERAYVGGRV
jgi:phage protein D